jgi:hypothetical protein
MLYRTRGGIAAGDTLINGFLFSLNNRLESQRGGAQNTTSIYLQQVLKYELKAWFHVQQIPMYSS